jgi:hypothetical protein
MNLTRPWQKISEGDRALVLLRFYREQSLEQIAQILGITEAAARKRLSRAIIALRRLLRSNVSNEALSMAALAGAEPMPSEFNPKYFCHSAGNKKRCRTFLVID